MTRAKIQHLRAVLEARLKEYQKFSLDARYERSESNRYEGIATGTRWALEDLIEMVISKRKEDNQ